MLSERDLIRRYLRPLAGEAGLALADDAALLRPEPGYDIVITKDLVAEGIHFLRQDPAAAIAAKALRVNLSDLAAKGAEPLCYFLGLGLGPHVDEAWVASFVSGLGRDQDRYEIQLAGGDTIGVSDGTVVSITALGRVPSGEAVGRGGATPGDIVVVSGTIGDAAIGLKIRNGFELEARGARDYLIQRLMYPEPRTEAASLIRRFASAAMDISDGLVADLESLCAASGVGARVEASRISLSDAAAAAISVDSSLLETALTGGEDFEILAAIPPAALDAFVSGARERNLAFTPIGRLTDKAESLRVVDGAGETMHFQKAGFDHLERPPASNRIE